MSPATTVGKRRVYAYIIRRADGTVMGPYCALTVLVPR
jgi:hypothetical protein